MSSEQQQASQLLPDLSDNAETYEDQMSSLWQMIKMGQLDDAEEAKKEFKPLIQIINDSSRYVRLAGKLIRGDAGTDEKKRVQERMRLRYGTDMKAVLRLAEDLKDQEELEEFRELMKTAEVGQELKRVRPKAGIMNSALTD